MITPYITFNGHCKEAIAFYSTIFTCEEPQIIPYGDYMPEGSDTPPELLREWVMHGEIVINGTNVWFADEALSITPGNNIKLSATVKTGKEADEIFNALSVEGKVILPPTETFYSVFHGAVIDRFGINWNIIAEEAPKNDNGD